MRKIENIVIIAATDFPYGTSNANLLRTLGIGFQHHSTNVSYILTRGNIYPNPPELSKRTNSYRNLKFTYSSFKKRPNSYLLKIMEVFISVFTAPLILIGKRISGEADAVILYTGYAYQNLPLVLTCKISGIHVYKYSVDWYNKEAVARKWWMLPKWWMFNLEISFLDRFLNGIIPISGMLYEHYKKIGVDSNKLLLIPNVLDLKVFEEAAPILHRGKKIRIGYCGAAPLLNGVDDLIRAFGSIHKKYADAELLVVGDVTGEKSQVPLLRKLAGEYGVEESTTFTGRVPGQDVPAYLASCDILVLARKNTQYAQAGFPTKLGEYFAAGKAVVMTRVGDITAYFTNGEELIIVEPDDPTSLAEGLETLIKDPEGAERIAKKGHLWAKENLDYIITSGKIKGFMLSN